MSTVLRILMLGDLVGKTGRDLFARHSATLRTTYSLDAIIINGENCADGKGITPSIVKFLQEHGVDIITSGNHIFDKKEIFPFLDEYETVLRPANYPDACPGKGITFFTCKGFQVAVMNIMGRLYMPVHLNCPFQKALELVQEAQKITPLILIDFHAETTAEKRALGALLDGTVSAVVGTHTHVQTADAQILPQGTAYISDLGMSGSLNSMIGAKKEQILHRFLTQMPVRHEVATDAPYVLSGVVVALDGTTGKALSIEPIYIVDEETLC
jgi:metallophosphoesterase (TIGR00282 family)